MMLKFSDIFESIVPDGWRRAWEYQLDLESKSLDITNFIPHYLIPLLMQLEKNEGPQFNVLDLGCGSGKEASILAKFGHHVIGIDALVKGIELAKRRSSLMKIEDKTDYFHGNILDYTIPKESYDIIISLQCIQYLFDDAKAKFEEMLEGISPGGYIVFSSNCDPNFITNPQICIFTQQYLKEKLDGWIIHHLFEEEKYISPDVSRKFVSLIAKKSLNSH